MGVYTRADGATVVEIETYDYYCDIGQHSVTRDIVNSPRCDRCGRVGCRKHVPHFQCCEQCWSNMSNAERQRQKNRYRKTNAAVIGFVIYSIGVLFGLPFLIWRMTGNNFAIIGGVFGGLVLWLIPLIFFIKKRVEDSKYGPKPKSSPKSKTNPQATGKSSTLVSISQTTGSNATFKLEDGREVGIDAYGTLILESRKISAISRIKGNLNSFNQVKSLHLTNNKITNLNGLERFSNLQLLNISSNQLTSLDGIAKHNFLEVLMANNNKIKKIEGLEQLVNLKTLFLAQNQITKIEGLNTLRNLKKLNISFNPITKLEGLETLTSLEEIKLQDTPLATQYAGKSAQELVNYCRTSK